MFAQATCAQTALVSLEESGAYECSEAVQRGVKLHVANSNWSHPLSNLAPPKRAL